MESHQPHIHGPQGPHTHTFIMLHGRGGNGRDFCQELFQSVTSQMKTLPESLPGFRWVFPSSSVRYSTAFDEHEPAWFDVYSLTNIEERRELQVDGLRESVSNIMGILSDEIELVGGDRSRVFLGGISQGMATTLWSFLCAPGQIKGPLGGVIAFCGWLPFAGAAENLLRRCQAEELLRQYSTIKAPSGSSGLDKQRQLSRLFIDTIANPEFPQMTKDTDVSVLSSPVFVSHGTDDSLVSVRLGRQAARILQQIDVSTEWEEFTGAEAGGHWIKQPEGINQIVQFIQKQLDRAS